MSKVSKRFHKIFSPSKRRGEKGFTLIELLVVVGILGVLAGVVTLSVGQFIGTGAQQAADTELHNIQTAVVAHMANNAGAIPTVSVGAGGCQELIDDGYILDDPEHGTYTWDSDGKVTRAP